MVRGYTEEQIQWLRENVEGNEWKQITLDFNNRFCADKSERALKSYCNRTLKVYTGNVTTFNKGHTPWNKDIDKEEWMKHFSDDALENMSKTQLKKGHKRTPECDAGTETYAHKNCVLVKTGVGKYGKKKGWQKKDVLVWEEHTGVRPDFNSVMVHLDGNPANCDFENLYLTNRKVFSAALNGYGDPRKDATIFKTALMCEELKHMIINDKARI